MNRVIKAIETVRDGLNAGGVSQEKRKELSAKLDLEFHDYCDLQELKSLAVSSQIISLEEGMTIYQLMGNTHTTYNKLSCEEKIALTLTFKMIAEQMRTQLV